MSIVVMQSVSLAARRLREALAGAGGVGLVGGAVSLSGLSGPGGAAMVGTPSGSVGALLAGVGGALEVDRRDIEGLASAGGDFERIAARMRRGSLRLAVLGDSTEAGSGNGADSSYGECRAEVNGSHGNMLAAHLVQADPMFTAPSPLYGTIRAPRSASLTLLLPSYQFIVSAPEMAWMPIDPVVSPQSELTIYYGERTHDRATTFRARVIAPGGAVLADQVIDSYTPAVVFGSAGAQPVGMRLASATLALSAPTTAATVEISEVSVIDRGSGVPPDGTALIAGFAWGKGVKFRNFAVSSTTLLDASAANISRGITTTERVAKAVAWGANAVLIGWGTNDSKAGVSTVAAFEGEYRALIDALRAAVPSMAIVCCTDPKGAAGSQYQFNGPYNAAIRRVALEKRCDLFDVERLLSGDAGAIADDVHPSLSGYQTCAEAARQRVVGALPVATARADKVMWAMDWVVPQSEGGAEWGVIFEGVMAVPPGARSLRVGARLAVAAYVELLSEFVVEVQGQSGAYVSIWVPVDDATVAVPIVAGIACGQVALHGRYTFGAQRELVRVRVRAKNYRLRASNTSKAWAELFIGS